MLFSPFVSAFSFCYCCYCLLRYIRQLMDYLVLCKCWLSLLFVVIPTMSSKKVITCGFVCSKSREVQCRVRLAIIGLREDAYSYYHQMNLERKTPSTFIGSKTLSRLEAITVTYNVHKFESARACIRPCLKTQHLAKLFCEPDVCLD